MIGKFLAEIWPTFVLCIQICVIYPGRSLAAAVFLFSLYISAQALFGRLIERPRGEIIATVLYGLVAAPFIAFTLFYAAALFLNL